MAVNLLPCPFCGSDRVTVWNIRDGQQAVYKECKSTGAPTFHGKDGPSATSGHAADAWNRRAALSSDEEKAVEVKKLDWSERDDTSHCAPSHIGHYHIFPGTGFSYDLCGPVGGRLATFKRLEAAKAAAQQDYETRIRSALVDVPAVEEPVADPEPIAWYMNLWNEADEEVKSDVRWGRPTGEDIERAEHNGHDIEYLYGIHPPRPSLIQSDEGEIASAAQRYVNAVSGGPGSDASDDEWRSYDNKKQMAFDALRAALSTRKGTAGGTSATSVSGGDHD